MGILKNKYYIIMPIAAVLFAVLFQGLFTTISTAICVLVLIISTKDKKLELTDIVSILLILLGFIVSDIFHKNDLSFISGMIKPLLLFAPMLITNENQQGNMFKAVYWGINLSSLLAITAYIVKLSSWNMTEYIGGKLHLQGVYGYSNTMAVICAVGIILALYYIKSDKDKSFLHEIMLGINALCLFFTYSMLTIAILLVVLVFGLSCKYKKFRIVAAIVFGIGIATAIVIIVSGNADMIIGSTLACRLIYWYDAIRVIIRNPFGIGIENWNNMQYEIQTAQYSVKYVHNGFLQFALDGGLIALGGLVLIITNRIIGIVKEFRKTKDYKLIYILMAVIAILGHSFVDIDMIYGVIWLILGILLTFSPKKTAMVKNSAVISIFITVISVCALFTSNITTDRLQVMSNKFSECVNSNNIQAAYQISKEMTEYAPRQQISYDAHYFVLSKQENEGDIKTMIVKVKSVNQSMNPLSKFMSEHKEIILPIGGGVK